MNEILKRLKNPSTIIAIASSVIAILMNLGVEIDNETVMVVVNSACTIGLAVGVLNDPSTKGIDGIAKKEEE